MRRDALTDEEFLLTLPADTHREILPKLTGRTITAYATADVGDLLQVVILTLDDGSWFRISCGCVEHHHSLGIEYRE